MKKRITLIISVSLIGILNLLLLMSAISNERENNAAANYKEYCAGCHGAQLKSFVDRKWLYGNSWNEVFKAIKYGYPDDGMPAYDTTFTDHEIDNLVDFILGGIEKLTSDDFEEKPDWIGFVESEELDFRLDTVVNGLGVPWGLAFLPDGDMLIAERSGKFSRYREGEALHPIKGVPEVLAKGQGGLMDVEVHPNFANNQWIYLSYSKPQGGNATTAIMRARLQGDELVDQKVIFEAQPYESTRHHYGSRLEFDKKGKLYFSVGDRGQRDRNPQKLDNHCGKIHRINEDGSIPKDNPFVNVRGAKSSIYSYGHRNPQGVAMHPQTGEIWETEHGPRGGDEVNIINKGQNYGWPVISYGINYNGTTFTDLTEKKGMEQPEYYWVPSIGACGLTFVNSDKYPNWNGDLLAGSLRFQYLARLKIEDNKVVGEEKLLKKIGRLRDVKMGNDGYIYFSVEDPGRVFRIVPR
ncbi:MAG: hypothetical protein DHS20C18_44590 [Saprospiraceae bacterium]|nr:MAG: hypothetical protein DHS20C18_44590 [Saprospiraceae bacterium]